MEMKNAVATLSALAQPTRLRVYQLLTRHGSDGLTAGEIAKLADTAANTMSAHLAILSRAGLVVSERRGREVVYRAKSAGLRQLTDHLLKLGQEADAVDSKPGS